MQTLHAHHNHLDQDIAGKEQQYDKMQTDHTPYLGLISLKHVIYKREAERKIIEDLLTHIEADEDWNHFPVLCE